MVDLEPHGVKVTPLENQQPGVTRIIPWHRVFEVSYPPLFSRPREVSFGQRLSITRQRSSNTTASSGAALGGEPVGHEGEHAARRDAQCRMTGCRLLLRSGRGW